MKYSLSFFLCLAVLSGCATIETVSKAPNGWEIKQTTRGVGSAGIEAAQQGVSAEASFQDGVPTHVKIDSNQDGVGVQSELEGLGNALAPFVEYLRARGVSL